VSLSALDLAKALIGFDTTSRSSNLTLIDFAQELLEGAGARCRRSYDPGGTKANLYATLGPETDGGYVLSGTPTWCRWTGRNGRAIPSLRRCATGICSAAAPAT
jgi:hypothetical protein